ncbi:chemotaxis protein CheW [Methyloradius palustris]|uniref:Chemotaxis protein CheW n=1 Tax=Methyloradius palustris TaxID=2778876 RepID=A0A8E4BUI9_9PROT|nr:chemotaxis protein CheW [Methyloradius palustris]BCM26183.1 chemotaxis protein CheW [Methyloradius palustris]
MNAAIKTSGASPATSLQLAALGIADSQQYLTFMLGTEVFAINILNIKEIIEYGQLTEVPRMPEFIRGVINLRGAVVPVIDLGARFGKQPTSLSRRTCVVIIEVEYEGEQQVVGVMVDAVNEVMDILPDQIEPAPNFGANIRADFIAGMGKVEGKFVIILNVSYVLSLEEIATLAAVGDAA